MRIRDQYGLIRKHVSIHSFQILITRVQAVMSSCETCTFNYYNCIHKFYEDNEKSIEFLRSHGVLPTTVTCPRCKTHCNYRKDQNLWRCRKSYVLSKTKKRRYCEYSASDFKGSFLENTNIPPWKIILFVNHFLSHLWDHRTMLECLKISSTSSVAWRSFCCEVTDGWFSNQEPIGGEGIEVETGKTLIDHRKCEKGQILSQIWLFGGIERESKRRFVVSLPSSTDEKHDKTSLLPFIRKFIKPGSVIYTDSLTGYETLSDLGYRHFAINNLENVDKTNVNTENIERFWRDLKEWVKRPGIRSKYLYQYLARYLFISSIQDKQNLLHQFFIEAAKLYQPLSDRERPPNNLELDSGSEEHQSASASS